MSKLELIVQQDNVRKFSARAAARRRRLQPVRNGRIRFQQSVSRKFVDGLNTGTRKLGNVIAVEKLAIKIGRIGCRQGHQAAHAQGAAKRGCAYAHAKRIDPPQEHQYRSRDRQTDQNRFA